MPDGAASDPFDLARFVEAQEGVYPRALEEIRRGRKTTHWIWFVFPQLAGLGASATAKRYAIGSLAEAKAYLAHPVLGPRLQVCVEAVCALQGRTPDEVFGHPDDLKLCSSLTLFERAAPDDPLFARALDSFYRGRRDPLTLQKLDERLG